MMNINSTHHDAFDINRVVPNYGLPGSLLLFDNTEGNNYLTSLGNPEGSRFMHLMVFVPLRGELDLIVNGQKASFKQGQIFTSYPDVEMIYSHATPDTQYLLFVIYPDMLKSIYDDIMLKYDITNFQHGYIISDVTENSLRQIVRLYNELKRECIHDDYTYRDTVIKNLLDLLVIKVHVINNLQDNLDTDPDSRQYVVYQKFLKLLNEYADKERTVQFYADELQISPKYLSYVTIQYTGKNASQWIGEYVVVKARTLISVHHKSTAEVAELLHFENTNSFNRFFKRVSNITPREYIKQLKEKSK